MTEWIDFISTDNKCRVDRNALQARINKTLIISVSIAAWKAIGKPVRVSFKTSQQPRAIAIYPAPPGIFSVYAQGSTKTGNHSVIDIYGKSVLSRLMSDLAILPKIYPVAIEDNMIVISLDAAE